MQILKYFFVGGAAAGLDIALFTLFAVILKWPWLPVSICTFILATLLNYVLSIRFVFTSGSKYSRYLEILGVFLVSSLALLVNQIVLYISIESFGLNLILSKVLATGIVFFWNYFGRSKLIFSGNHST